MLKRTLDIGCGPGDSTDVFAKVLPHMGLVGIDEPEGMAIKAREAYLDTGFKQR